MVGREFTYSLTLYCVLGKSVRSLNQTMDGESNYNESYRELDRIDEEPMEFEWMMNPGHTTLHILLEIQKLLKDLNYELEQLKGRIIFMSMYNDIVWRFTKRTGMSYQCHLCDNLCKEVLFGSLIMPRTRICGQDTSLSWLRSQSWIRISNGLDKFVRDLTEKARIPCENDDSSASTEQESRIVEYSRPRADKSAAKAKPKSTPSSSLSSSPTSVPLSERI